MTLTRRSLFGGLAGLLAAPAIVKASSLMAVKPVKLWKLTEVTFTLNSAGNLVRLATDYYVSENPFHTMRELFLNAPTTDPGDMIVSPQFMRDYNRAVSLQRGEES